MSKIAFLFPGQGSQSVGMGAAYLESEPRARQRLAEASEILGYDLSDLSLRGPAERLNLTLHTQPAIFSHSSLVLDLLEDRGVSADFVAGHSVGEFGALYAARAQTFPDLLSAVARRAELMHAAGQEHPGAMAAVLGLSAASVRQACGEVEGVVVVANDNSPAQVVISGEREAVGAAGERLRAAGARRVVPLPVSGAFHSPLMESAQGPLLEYLRGRPWRAPERIFVANADARPHREAAELPALLGGQLTSGVRWTETIQYLLEEGVTTFIEVGPGRVLTGLLKAFEGEFRSATTETPEALAEAVALAGVST